MKCKCPVCGGELVSGLKLTSYPNSDVTLRTVQGLFGDRYRVRARLCVDCGHLDFYVPKADFEKKNN